MAGHSKWHNIQKRKGAVDAKRGQLFTKLAKAITVAAKMGGGGDPEFNFQLRVAIDAAKSANMPKDNIERAIKRGTGEGGDSGIIEEVIYEGFGPGGAGLLIKCLTDNRNRSVADVRTVMNKNGGNIGEKGTVMWMFDLKGLMLVPGELTDQLELEFIEAGVEDLQASDGVIEIITASNDLKRVLDVVEGKHMNAEHAGLDYLPKDSLSLSDQDMQKLEKLVGLLDELDDVDTVYTNVN